MTKIPHFQKDSELFDFVRQFQIENSPDLQDIFANYNFNSIQIDVLLNKIFHNHNNILLIDVRSEKEYSETFIPGALNFPILNTNERHNVGQVFKKYSQKAAIKLAVEYANIKYTDLNNFLKKNFTQFKTIVLYCWRGGGRSKFVAKMITDLGYKPFILSNGIKSYRNMVVNLFNLNHFPLNLIEIRGMTGCGKTEILKTLKSELPVIDLEDAARHFSSLFGNIPYLLKGIEPIKTQKAFENNIFSQYIKNQHFFTNSRLYLIESESKKVGNFTIPTNLYSKINDSKCINVFSKIESRVQRIISDYFYIEDIGIAEIMKILTEKERVFRKEMSNKYYESALNLLRKGQIQEFIEIMLLKYYDKKYRVKDKNPIADIRSDNISEAANSIKNIYRQLN